MISKEEQIAYMITKECTRDSLSDLCDYWGVTIEDFERFINVGMKYFDKEDAEVT